MSAKTLVNNNQIDNTVNQPCLKQTKLNFNKCQNYSEVVKRTIVKAKAIGNQTNVRASPGQIKLFANSQTIGQSSHQMDPIVVPNTTNCCTLNTTMKPCVLSTVVEPPRDQRPPKRQRTQTSEPVPGPSSRPDTVPDNVPEWARIADSTEPKGIAPDIPENCMGLYRTLRNLEAKQAKCELNLEYLNRYYTGRITPKSYLLEIQPTYGRDNKDFMNNWFALISKTESAMTKQITDHVQKHLADLNVTIADARRTLARCLVTDKQTSEVHHAINAVRQKVIRKERAVREERHTRDSAANHERINRRLGRGDPVKPSEKVFLPPGAPKQGRPQIRRRNERQPRKDYRPTSRNGKQSSHREQRQPANRRDERPPRGRDQRPTQQTPQRQEITLSYLMRELKKLQKRR